AQLDLVRLPAQPLDDVQVLLGRQRDLAQLPPVQGDRAHVAAAAAAVRVTDRNSSSPSVPPSAASAQRSGCGIMPSTLPRSLTIPATWCSEPLGLAEGSVRPPGSQ